MNSSATPKPPIRELAELLTELCHDAEEAQSLAIQAGFPVAHLPEFKTPIIFWTKIVRASLGGRMHPAQLVEVALKQFPHNLELRRQAERFVRTELQVVVIGEIEPKLERSSRPVRRQRSWILGLTAGIVASLGLVVWVIQEGSPLESMAKETLTGRSTTNTLEGTNAETPGQPVGEPLFLQKPTELLDEARRATQMSETRTADTRAANLPKDKGTDWTGATYDIPIDGSTTIRMIRIHGGEFIMGSPDGEGDPEDKDEAEHEAAVSDFWIAEAETTQSQWKVVLGTEPSDCTNGCGVDLPVNMVSWEDTLLFTNALSKQLEITECYSQVDGVWTWANDCDGMRLPTEAEWEYAARARTVTHYSFGSSVVDACKYGNLADASAKAAHPEMDFATTLCNDGHPELAPVKSFEPNPWLLYDMHGNVNEWVWDGYGFYVQEPTIDHRGPKLRRLRVMRGGSFRNSPPFLRSANRGAKEPAPGSPLIGFRCARGAALPGR